jgi:hypothetical protein
VGAAFLQGIMDGEMVDNGLEERVLII